ncbi:MAG: LytTR family transcriptional regulator DNA-binding domain-containing protein [Thermaurantimonas sp.]|uniref:LytTR family transcriptional regulator DNA-binding domain-containing protein n=1 Tax=Thermaurantimonas sp. TaxID=2681568 RepID=UPI00391B833B
MTGCLPELFVRVHKSYMVSMKFIRRVDQDTICADKYFIPIGNSCRARFFSRLQQIE